MSEITASTAAANIAPPPPTAADRMKFYSGWIAVAVILLLLPKVFSSGGSVR